jgi:RNA polymerase sigma-70 factor (ECF subfamily)
MFSEDRDYVDRILAGEPDAFESLVRKYNRLGGAIAFGILGDFHLAEDVVQEAFITAFRALSSLREPGKFRFWFAGLVRSKALDALRQRRTRQAVPLEEGLAAGGSFGGQSPVEEEHMRDELRQKVLDAIGELPPEDRTVVMLKHMEGLSYKEIAELTGSTVSSVESRLFRARNALRKKLDRSKAP